MPRPEGKVFEGPLEQDGARAEDRDDAQHLHRR
jgi:hypothetical protein